MFTHSIFDQCAINIILKQKKTKYKKQNKNNEQEQECGLKKNNECSNLNKSGKNDVGKLFFLYKTMSEKCPNAEFFLFVFYRFRTRKNSVFGHFSHSVTKKRFRRVFRRMRNKWYFRNDMSQNFSERPAFTIKSKWKPSKDHPSLEVFLYQIEKEPFELVEFPLNYSNFSKNEWKAMWSLVNDRKVVINFVDCHSHQICASIHMYIYGLN